ncbi:MAG: ribonuclease E/G [Clostridiales bacterium]|nr:ribonuclease E/G [Clostridiales bacterium]
MKRVIVCCGERLINTALTEDGELIEVISSEKRALLKVGDIYTGKIKRILKSGFAFIDLGRDRNAFLYLRDKKEQSLWDGSRLRVKEGNDIVVQVEREAENEKGAAVTTALSLSGELAVVSLGRGELRISKKITGEKKRSEIKELFGGNEFSDLDIIIRTKAEETSPENLKDDVSSAAQKLRDISELGLYRKAPACLYENESETLRAMKAFGDFKLVSDNTEVYYKYIDPNRLYTPTLYEGEIPIFKEYFIESKIKKALSPKVWLKSGGWLTIENTEAMVVIDVNSGKNNTKPHEETVFKTNLEAAEEILKQLRLRNLSGMIAVDFINMNSEDNNKRLIEVLEEKARADRISVTVVGMVKLGFVLITRKKSGLPLKSRLTSPCPHCGGTGFVSIY